MAWEKRRTRPLAATGHVLSPYFKTKRCNLWRLNHVRTRVNLDVGGKDSYG